jgi:hypothetical protein
VLTFESYRPEEIVAITRHIAGNEKIAIAEAAWALLQAETLAVAFAANRFRYVPVLGGVTARRWTRRDDSYYWLTAYLAARQAQTQDVSTWIHGRSISELPTLNIAVSPLTAVRAVAGW